MAGAWMTNTATSAQIRPAGVVAERWQRLKARANRAWAPHPASQAGDGPSQRRPEVPAVLLSPFSGSTVGHRSS